MYSNLQLYKFKHNLNIFLSNVAVKQGLKHKEIRMYREIKDVVFLKRGKKASGQRKEPTNDLGLLFIKNIIE